MQNSNSKAGSEVPTGTKADVTTSRQTIAKHIVRRRQSYRLKQLLNWYRTANPEKFIDFHYTRWVAMVGGVNMKDALYKATEDQLDDLYILREELRLGI